MSTLSALREGITASIRKQVTDVEVYPYEPGTISGPAILVLTPTIDYQRAFSGSAPKMLAMRVWLLVAPMISEEAARLIARCTAWDGPVTTSIAAAINADATFGGVLGAPANLVSFRPFGAEEVAATGYWGGEFIVNCVA